MKRLPATVAIVGMLGLGGCKQQEVQRRPPPQHAQTASSPQQAQTAVPQRAQTASSPKPSMRSGEATSLAGRRITFNQRPLTEEDAQILQQLEARSGQRVPDGDYWYDGTSGATGKWGGPTQAIIPPGLGLGGSLPANASGGGTHVFINGREIHPIDLQYLQQLIGPVQPGRYWVDAQGNGGMEGGPAIVNLYAAARQRGGAASGGNRPWTYRSDGLTGRSRDNINAASDGQTSCFTTAGRTVCTDGNN